MSGYGAPLVVACLIWWFTTGVILFLDGLPRRTFRWSMLAATALLALAFYGLVATRDAASVWAAYLAFVCAIVVWGWQEMSFLMGYVTGPRKQACAPGCRGWRHFGHGAQAILYHELLIAVAGALVIASTWGGANSVGAWTFAILWAMRLSAKLNLFLGVPNLGEAFLPEHLAHLRSFFTRKPMNLLFPLSVTIPTVVVALLVEAALGASATDFEITALMLLASLLALAVVEHWFMVLPLPATALWAWGLRSHARAAGEPEVRRKNGSAFAAR